MRWCNALLPGILLLTAQLGQAAPTLGETALSVVQNGIQRAVHSLLDPSFNHSVPVFGATVDKAASGAPRANDYWGYEEGVGHFSEWSKLTKFAFLRDWADGKAGEWTIVMGNEGGDLDSMAAALTWAYHLGHSTLHEPVPRKAIALLQTTFDALDLRPENKLALDNSKMSSGHRDLLTIDELPEPPSILAPKLGGIVLVDHPRPLSVWKDAKIVSIIDHHVDRGIAKDAEPRVFEIAASCTTLVARQMLDELEAMPRPPNGPGEYHTPHELFELILDAIAIDSDGLNPKKSTTDTDRAVSARVLARSNWHKKKLGKVMDRLDKALSKAKKDLSHLSIRDLLRRDWKGDVVETLRPHTPDIHLGFASTPVSLDDQIKRAEGKSIRSWLKIERAWTAEIGADVSLCLNSYKDDDKNKIREIVLAVRHDHRINRKQADDLFRKISRALESELDLTPHPQAKYIRGRQMAWTHTRADAGRKVVRPIVERAVKSWKA